MFDLFGQQTQMQEAFAFPAPLTEKYRPRRIEDFIGLDKVKRVLSRFAANPGPSAWLFTGASGTGKTTMAMALAQMIPAEVHHIPSQECTVQAIERVRQVCQYVPAAGYRMHLVLVDEADRMSDAAQISLLSKLDSTNFPPATVFIFTSNDTARLEPRFLSRLRTLEFSSYGISGEAAELLSRVWLEETGQQSGPNFTRIVKDSANNIRESLMRLETAILEA